jgi:signal transduction histidine kinase
MNDPVKFLLVDDREDNLLALEALLRQDGLDLLKARSGDEALELLLVHDAALALVDVQMPEMDGFALAELMRGSERSRHVPIIFLTADASEQQRVFRGYDAGAVDFLVKPVEPRILRHKAQIFFQLYKQRQDLLDTLRVNETFTAVVGHDLKNPLHAMLAGTELLAATTLEPRTRKTAERLKTTARRMARMIDDIFDLSRARLGGGIPIESQPVDLVAIVRRVIGDQETTSPERVFRFQNGGSGEGDWDGARLEQVASNLIGNAVRHGAPDTAIDVGLDGCDAAAVTLSVHNGGRIAPDVRQHLFDPFRAGRSNRARGEGLGLGLYIVHQIVLAHGGSIEVCSNELEGTTFIVRLPRSRTPPPLP